MEIYGLPVCYHDENNLWHDFFAYIESLFPLQEIKVDSELNIQTVKNVRISFFPHNDNFWEQNGSLINTYKKSYLNIYLLSFEDYDDYKKNIFSKVEEFVKNNYKNSEWRVVYFPNILIKNENTLVYFLK